MDNQKQANPKPQRWQEIRKMKAEINKLKTMKIIQRIGGSMNWFFEKINNIDTPWAQLNRREKEVTQANRIVNEQGNTLIESKELQNIIIL